MPMTLRASQTGKHVELILVPTTCNYSLLDQVLIILLKSLFSAQEEFSTTKNYHNITASPLMGRNLVSMPLEGAGKLSLIQLPSLICRSQYASYSLSLPGGSTAVEKTVSAREKTTRV